MVMSTSDFETNIYHFQIYMITGLTSHQLKTNYIKYE